LSEAPGVLSSEGGCIMQKY